MSIDSIVRRMIKMLNRPNKLDLPCLKKYLKSIVREFVEKPGKIRVSADSSKRKVLFTLSVHEDDLPILEQVQETYRALNHIMRKVTQANIGKDGQLDNEFGVTT
jgi:hypothetical protein